MRLLLAILLAVMLGGCGHKGPLYLSKPKPDAQKPAPPVAVLPDERELPGTAVK